MVLLLLLQVFLPHLCFLKLLYEVAAQLTIGHQVVLQHLHAPVLANPRQVMQVVVLIVHEFPTDLRFG